jgi:hypothetical protein
VCLDLYLGATDFRAHTFRSFRQNMSARMNRLFGLSHESLKVRNGEQFGACRNEKSLNDGLKLPKSSKLRWMP